ncbi:MAG: response regulator [Candidatus Omnitrophica bacterium]|nr:response regulator [Candidatus Omnitrophota bacterium]
MDTERRKIVFADDNHDVREIVVNSLENAGYYIDTVNDGFELLTYLKENQDMDAIILDLMMPECGGLSIFETVRSLAPASKIIIFTDYSNYKQSVYGKSADAFVEKFEGVDKVLKVLEELF